MPFAVNLVKLVPCVPVNTFKPSRHRVMETVILETPFVCGII
jgi:hypothetical protein